MRDWMPFLQALIWPVVVLILAFTFRSGLKRLIAAVNTRVERGDTFEAGVTGVRIGPAAPEVPTGGEPQPGAQRVLEIPPQVAEESTASTGPGVGLHLVHTARRDSSLDSNGYKYWRIRIRLESDRDADLDRVAKVVYHLHPTFRDPDRTVTDGSTGFELTTAGWGMFTLTADVHLKGSSEPIRLERYLNFS